MKKRRKKSPKHKNKSAHGQPYQKSQFDWEPILIILAVSIIFAGSFWLGGQGVFLGLTLGAYIGFAGLPVIDPKKYHERWIECAVLGGVGCGWLAIKRDASPNEILIAVVAGVIFGLFAPAWARYM